MAATITLLLGFVKIVNGFPTRIQRLERSFAKRTTGFDDPRALLGATVMTDDENISDPCLGDRVLQALAHEPVGVIYVLSAVFIEGDQIIRERLFGNLNDWHLAHPLPILLIAAVREE